MVSLACLWAAKLAYAKDGLDNKHAIEVAGKGPFTNSVKNIATVLTSPGLFRSTTCLTPIEGDQDSGGQMVLL